MSRKGADILFSALPDMTPADRSYFLGFVAESIPERKVREALRSLDNFREREARPREEREA